MQPILDFITRRASIVLWVSLLLTLLAVSRIVDLRTGQVLLELDPSLDALLPQGDEGKRLYDRMRLIFGSDETILVEVVSDDVFTPGALRAVTNITKRIAALDGVRRVESLSTAMNVRAEGEDLAIEPFFVQVPEDRDELERIRRDVLANPIYKKSLISPDQRATAIMVHFIDMGTREFSERGLDTAIERIVEEERGSSEVRITGLPRVKIATSAEVLSTLQTVIPIIILCLAGISFLFFPTLRGVLVPVGAVLLSLIWTCGVMAASGEPMNVVTMIVPPLTLTIGYAYSIHIIAAYYEALRERAGRSDATGEVSPTRAALGHVAQPVVLTAVTTVVGFASLTVSGVSAVKEFGVFSVVGVIMAALISLTTLPALLQALGSPRREPRRAHLSWFDNAAERLARFDLRRRTPILMASGVLAVIAGIGISQVRITTDAIGNFRESAKVRLDYEAINRDLGGANPLYVVLQEDEPDAFTDPESLKLMDNLQRWLDEQPGVGGTMSLVDHVKLIHQAFNENDPAYYSIPDDQDLIGQLLVFGGSDSLEEYVDSRFKTARILVRATVIESDAVGQLADRIDEHLRGLRKLNAQITGNTVLMARTVDDIARGQVASLGLALAIVYLILVLLFTSFSVGFMALIPNILPVAAFFGAIGLSGITLTSTTSLIAAMVLGIAVDDSIHYLAQFNAQSRARASESEGTVAALRMVAQPVTVTTLALTMGFLAFTLSDLRNQVHFGALSAFTLAIAWLFDLTLTPALASGLRIVSLWDMMSLDLGEDPQSSIPLFRGLNRPRARIVALMGKLQRYGAGQRVITAGSSGDEMYVVIDGELRVSAQTERGTVVLEDLKRGDSVGDLALFHGKRTADVDAMTDVRLLALSRASLERLARRYPKTALQVSQNLNEILGHRLIERTARVR